MVGQSLTTMARWLWETIARKAPSKHHISCVQLHRQKIPRSEIARLLRDRQRRWVKTRAGNVRAGRGNAQSSALPKPCCWRRAAATQAVGARGAVPDPGLPSGSSGRGRLMPWSPHGEAISPLHAGCCLRWGVPAPAARARGEGGWLLLQTRLTKCWYYA